MILYILLIALLVFMIRNAGVEKFTVSDYLTTSAELGHLAETVKKVFELHGVPYYITGTTLLGAVTRGTFLQGDDVLHIGVPQSAVKKLYDLTDLLAAEGLYLRDVPDGGILLTPTARWVPLSASVHISVMTPAGDRWLSTSSLNPQEWFFSRELVPIRWYDLAGIKLPGPRDPGPYLRRNFWSGTKRRDHVRLPRPPIHLDPGYQYVVLGNTKLVRVPTGGPAVPPGPPGQVAHAKLSFACASTDLFDDMNSYRAGPNKDCSVRSDRMS